MRALPQVMTLLLVAALCGSAMGGEPADEDAARQFYEAGTAAYQAGDYNGAAQAFARADSLAAHPVALRWALLSTVKADDPVLGMTLVERARARSADPALDEARGQAEKSFSTRVAPLTVRCAAGETCTGAVDGKPVAVGQAAYYLTGAHVVRLEGPGGELQRTIVLEAGHPLEVALPPKAPPPPASSVPSSFVPPPAPRREPIGRISPAFFAVTLAATAALGGVAIWSGVDTIHRHDAYLDARTTALYDAGRQAQLRTNVLIGVTAGGAATTIVLGIFTRWSTNPSRAHRPASLGGAR